VAGKAGGVITNLPPERLVLTDEKHTFHRF
jgi:hypothetical protein